MKRSIGMLTIFLLVSCVPRGEDQERTIKSGDEPPVMMDPMNQDPPPTDPPPTDPPPTDPPPTDPPPTDPPPTDPPPTDPNALRFGADIKPLLEAHCTECHDGGRALDFTKLPLGPAGPGPTVELILAAARGPMPPTPRDRMSTADLEKIELWRDQGLLP